MAVLPGLGGVGGFAMSFVNPLSLDGCAVWLDASDSSTITLSGSNASAWASKAPGGITLTQGTAGSRPTINSAAKNGLDVLSFDGGDRMDATGLSLPSICSIFAVLQTTASGNTKRALVLGNGGEFGTNQLYMGANGTTSSAGMRQPSNVSIDFSYSQASYGHLSYIRPSTTSQRVRGGGGSWSENTTSTTSFTGAAFNVGGYSTGTVWWNGKIAEVIYYSRALDETTEVPLVESYLSSKWGL